MGISIKDVDVSSISPMMQHYVKTKEEYKDCILSTCYNTGPWRSFDFYRKKSAPSVYSGV